MVPLSGLTLTFHNNKGDDTMGGGIWDTGAYKSSATTRAATGVPDFAYTKTATKAHSNLDPLRIKDKPFGKLEIEGLG